MCGLNKKAIQNRLLTEKDLTLSKALEIAIGMEAAAKVVTELQATSNAGATPTLKGDVNKVATNCYHCGKPDHKAAQCSNKALRCYNCGKLGHVRKVCRQARKPFRRVPGRPHSTPKVKNVTEVDQESEREALPLNHVSAKPGPVIKVDLILNGKSVSMEQDTGAPVSLMSWRMLHRLFPEATLQQCDLPMQTYLGEPIAVRGRVQMSVCYKRQQLELPLVVVEGSGPCFFGRQWLEKICLDWHSINSVRSQTLENVLDRHQELFKSEFGTLEGYKAQILVDRDAQPRFCKARPVPYAVRSKVEAELECLEAEGVIEPIQFADWAAPIVAVLRADGKSVRICDDFKVTINQVSKLGRYPIPQIEDLLAQVAGGKAFTKLDMSQAYQQLPLDDRNMLS